ncbi:MAG: hypothetical protein KDC24_13675, partial [Saprospiraceae bacterium]|nr:hypothetical protein [Saprospiraceae bacterium]
IYVQHLYEEMTSKNKAMYLVIALLTVIIFGITILVIDEGQLFMAIVGVGLLVLLALFAFGMPTYYKNSNLKGDGIILIGSKYAYLNGYFHNWDFPLSGLEKVKKIKKPFYGLEIHYFFTDRTMTHTMEIQIPAPTNIDLDAVIEELKAANQ